MEILRKKMQNAGESSLEDKEKTTKHQKTVFSSSSSIEDEDGVGSGQILTSHNSSKINSSNNSNISFVTAGPVTDL